MPRKIVYVDMMHSSVPNEDIVESVCSAKLVYYVWFGGQIQIFDEVKSGFTVRTIFSLYIRLISLEIDPPVLFSHADHKYQHTCGE